MERSAIGVLSLMGFILTTTLAAIGNFNYDFYFDPESGEWVPTGPPQGQPHMDQPPNPPSMPYPNIGAPQDFPGYGNSFPYGSENNFFHNEHRGVQVAQPDYARRTFYQGESSNHQTNYEYGVFGYYDNTNDSGTSTSGSAQPFDLGRQRFEELAAVGQNPYERQNSLASRYTTATEHSGEENEDFNDNENHLLLQHGGHDDGDGHDHLLLEYEGHDEEDDHDHGHVHYHVHLIDDDDDDNEEEEGEAVMFEGEHADFVNQQDEHPDHGNGEEEPDWIEGVDCQFFMADLPSNHGLLIESEPWGNILYPNKEGIFYVKNGDDFIVNCGGGRLINILENEPLMFATIKCDSGLLVRMKRKKKVPVIIEEFQCNAMPQPEVTKSHSKNKTKDVCIPHSHYQVGFRRNLYNGFKLSYDVCVENDSEYSDPPQIAFVKRRMLNLKAREELEENVGMQNQLDVKIIKSPGIFDGLYKSVKLNLKNHLAGSSDFQKVQNHPDHYYLIPSFLLNKLYFPYAAEQLGHLLYINVKPMWTHLKNNWDLVEQYIHELAAKRDTPFDLYAGTHDYLQYRNQRLETKYLSLGPTEYPAQFVPKIFYKLLHDPDTNACVAIIGHNTPSPVGDADRICPIEKDVTSKITWLKQLGGPESGVVYPCPCKAVVVRDPQRPYESGLVQVGSMKIVGGDPLTIGGLLTE